MVCCLVLGKYKELLFLSISNGLIILQEPKTVKEFRIVKEFKVQPIELLQDGDLIQVVIENVRMNCILSQDLIDFLKLNLKQDLESKRHGDIGTENTVKSEKNMVFNQEREYMINDDQNTVAMIKDDQNTVAMIKDDHKGVNTLSMINDDHKGVNTVAMLGSNPFILPNKTLATDNTKKIRYQWAARQYRREKINFTTFTDIKYQLVK
jgi:hypothetical protein